MKQAFVWAAASVVAGCGQPPGDPDGHAIAEAILSAAEVGTGFGAAPGLVQLFADAAVVGPSGGFRTRMHSSSDGRVRMEQQPSGFMAGVGVSGGWIRGPDGAIDSLGSMIGFVRGHELHMLALVPRSRLENPRYLGSGYFADRATMAVAMSLPSGDSLVLHFGVQDTLPVGLLVTWTDPYVEVTFSDWDHSDGHRLFRTARFRQGEEEFHYVFDSLRLGPLPDSVFEPVIRGAERPMPD